MKTTRLMTAALMITNLAIMNSSGWASTVSVPPLTKKIYTKATVKWPAVTSAYAFAVACGNTANVCATVTPARLAPKFSWVDPAGVLTVSAGTDPSCNGGKGGFLTVGGPATGCTAGQQAIVAKLNGKVVSTGQGVLLGIGTETLATIPSDRTRKKLGVGEQVTLTLMPAGLSPITWSNTGGGTLGATSGESVIFTANDRAATPSVTATFAGVQIAAAFTVVEPGSESAIKTSEDSFPAGTQGAGMRLEITIAPTDVSFQNVESQEVPGPASNISGYFTGFPASQLAHNTAGWVQIAAGNKKFDHAAFSGFPSPWSAGGFEWDIPIQWRVVGSASVGTLPHRLQQFAITNSTGTSTVSKLGQSVTRTP